MSDKMGLNWLNLHDTQYKKSALFGSNTAGQTRKDHIVATAISTSARTIREGSFPPFLFSLGESGCKKGRWCDPGSCKKGIRDGKQKAVRTNVGSDGIGQFKTSRKSKTEDGKGQGEGSKIKRIKKRAVEADATYR